MGGGMGGGMGGRGRAGGVGYGRVLEDVGFSIEIAFDDGFCQYVVVEGECCCFWITGFMVWFQETWFSHCESCPLSIRGNLHRNGYESITVLKQDSCNQGQGTTGTRGNREQGNAPLSSFAVVS